MPAITELPPLDWTGEPGSAEYDDASGTLVLRSRAGVDWINYAHGGGQHAATALTFAEPDGDFMFSARVRVEGDRSTFDAAVLALWSDPDHWAKLCFEYSPHHQGMVVSVVTDGLSDDCNSTVVVDPDVHLRISRRDRAYAFHSSRDGITWDFVRYFALATGTGPMRVGFLAQCPTGAGCTAVFDGIRLDATTLADLRSGV
ncbi:hypothetical protein LK09_19160 [Microbacterium mangrovi]|uniref:Regulation of enolase 1 n=1 Tax=Microbacterium mangrovi TaxID=1348253 RepID=A0A0B2A1M2_9MICO|nr:DUF1349 domain-containing protein [Microbacterium mangrovi]KHK95495.1 hypothetical protein LK09_19160 [Microbacterium mangrovi]